MAKLELSEAEFELIVEERKRVANKQAQMLRAVKLMDIVGDWLSYQANHPCDGTFAEFKDMMSLELDDYGNHNVHELATRAYELSWKYDAT